jgi:hypothetical protein
LQAIDGRTFEFMLRAGVDTADWAYDRPDIRARIRHQRGNVAASYDVSDAQYKYKGHTYVTSFTLPEKTAIVSGEIVLEPQTLWPNLLLKLFRMSLVDAGQGKSYPLNRDSVRVENTSSEAKPGDANGDRWKLLAQTRNVNIYQNARALPRAWLAADARVCPESAMLQVIRTGILPDGSKWDPLRTALVEPELPTALANNAQDGRAEITGYEPNRVKVHTQSDSNSILVLSENDYPGWRVYVDGQPADLLRVNYALRGVMIGAGDHQVSFVYRPWSVMGGLLLSLITAAGLIVLSRVRVRSPTVREGHPGKRA